MTTPKKIPAVLLVGPGLRGGGAEGQFALMTTRLFAGLAAVALLTGRKEDAPDAAARRYFLAWRNGLSYWRIIPRFWWLVYRGGYRVIFAFGFFPSLLAVCATLFRRGTVSVIVSEITRPQKEDALAANAARRFLYRHLRRWCYRRAALLTANSIDGVREMCEIAGVAPTQGRRVMNLVEHERFLEKAEEQCLFSAPAAPYFVCVSRLDPMKRLDTVIAAFALLPRNEGSHLLIIGDGPARHELVAQAERLALGDRTHFSGWLENPLPLVKNAAAFILASEYEGFSNSVLEAMFLDTPVITSLCSADAEEMCESDAALGFAVGDTAALARHMTRILCEPGLSVALLGNARRYRLAHTLEEALPRYEEIILSIATVGSL
ncbi:MAG: glycosyltransferase [Desulfobulbaceae bacterium]|nr:glycosyltransferase [Desulfobulbaceae bacterium]